MVAAGGEPLVRKTVTVLFCDVVGSTSLGERVDPETTRRVIIRYFDETRAVLERHGGTVEKFIGDAVMAIFGVPILHEDDALRAVRAGDELRTRLDGLNDELERQWGIRLEWRIAINTGEVVVGDPDSTQTIASGDTVNVAARLQQAAQPGEILLGRETYRLVSDRVRAGPLESFSLKGKSELVKTWRLEQVRASAEQVFRRLDAPLIGREREQGILHDLYRRALDEQSCQLITVVGPAGIGKTRLAQEIAARLFGATVAQGRCLPYGDGITFFPVVEIVRSLAGVSADDAPEHIRARLTELAGDDELVVDRVAGVLGIGGETRADESFWALRRLFESVARDRPLVLVFEDLHWAEPTLLDFVEYVFGWSRGAPLLVVCLARPELFETRAAWPGERIALSPLAEDEVHALLGNLLGSAELDPDAARRIADAAEGNPLFLEELVRMLVDDGTLERTDGRWVATGGLDSVAIPPTINALIAARLDRLDPEERLVLQSAAVIGKQFWWSAVTELAPSALRPRVAAYLHGLVRKRLIFPAESTTFAGEDSFRFGHILVRDAAYGALPKMQRAELHERFAYWLEERGMFEEIRGHHLEHAYLARSQLAPVDEAVRAIGDRAGELLGSAGRRAAARADTPAAASLLTRAAALLAPGEQRAQVLVDLGMTQMRRGEFGAAQQSLEEAIASGAERIKLRARIELAFLEMLVDPKGATRRMREVAEEAIPALEALGDDFGQARAWWLRSEVDVVACRWSDRATALERAIVHARRAGDGPQQGILLRHLAQALVYGPAPVDDAIDRCEEFLVDADGDPVLRASLLSSLAGLHAMRGEFETARGLHAEARVIYDELGLNSLRAMRSLVPAAVEMLAGDPIAAERELRWGYDMLTALGERGVRSTLAAFLAEALYAQGRLSEAEQLTRTSEESAAEDDLVTQAVWRTARAKVLARRRELEAAEQLAEGARELAADTDFPDLQATAALGLAEVLLASGNRAEAEPLLEEAKDLYARKGNIVAAERTGEVLAANLA